MNNPVSPEVKRSVARDILDSIERLIDEAQAAVRPLEIDPYRARLFEMFVTADGAELVTSDEDMAVDCTFDFDLEECDLSADGLCRSLARRYGLDMAARESAAQQSRMPPEHLERMRLLWSVMRMWMEWAYAWRRWEEFHRPPEAIGG
ncbi:MAG: hypothetical protein R3C19_16230 [Planctomycetaceae bacterium]